MKLNKLWIQLFIVTCMILAVCGKTVLADKKVSLKETITDGDQKIWMRKSIV